jgi:hypothetical protein
LPSKICSDSKTPVKLLWWAWNEHERELGDKTGVGKSAFIILMMSQQQF